MELILHIDGTKKILESVQHAVADAEGISAAAEQLSASVKEVAHHATQVAEYADHAVQDVEAGRRVIEESLRGILALGDSFAEVYRLVLEGNRAAADARLAELEQASQQVVANLDRLLSDLQSSMRRDEKDKPKKM